MRLLHCHPAGFNPAAAWIQESESVRQDSRLFRQIVAQRRSPHTGRQHAFYRLQGPDWVNVVAFDDNDQLILVRQWRFGSGSFSVEIPAGALEPGEDPMVGGLRELVEETGYTPDDPAAVVILGATRPNPAFMANRCHTVFVPRATRTAPQRLDPTEEVEVLKMPRGDIDSLLREGARRAGRLSADEQDGREDVLDNALVVVALQLWRLHVFAARR